MSKHTESICGRKDCEGGCLLCDLKARLAYFEKRWTSTDYENDVRWFKNICIRVWEQEEYSVHQADLMDDGCMYLVDPEKDGLIYGIAHILKYLEYKGEINLKELGQMVKKITSMDLAKSGVHYGGKRFEGIKKSLLKKEKEENNE